jgi:hypothetical protein
MMNTTQTKRDEMERRMDWLQAQIAEIQDEITGGSYPNWYPETLAKFRAEWKALVFALHAA